MEIRPQEIRLTIQSPGRDWAGYVRAFLAILAESPFAPVERWEVPALEMAGEGLPGAVAETLVERAEPHRPPPPLQLILGPALTATLQADLPDPGGGFTFHLSREVSPGDSDESLVAFLGEAASLCRTAAERTDAVKAQLIPVAGGATCIPAPPLVGHNSHIALTSEKEVEANYDSPETFWSIGWESIEELGSRRMLLRGMDVVGGPEFLRKIIDQQWLLARAAKPGKTAYFLPQPESSERGIFLSGTPRLHVVGYNQAERLVEYSCAMSRGDRIPGWQIYELWNLVQEGALSDGRLVETVRVVFFDQWAALQERRPLLDIGCRVFHEAAGELRELTE